MRPENRRSAILQGRHIKTLYGREEDKRDVLLVVRYPALTNFRSMLESKIFQGVSVIRMAAVDNFTFGFTKRGDKGADLSPMNPMICKAFLMAFFIIQARQT